MSVQVTAEDVNQMLSELGYSVPSIVINAILNKVNSISDCLVAHNYSEADQLLILIYSACLLAQMQGARKITSQSAQSGSRSFQYDENSFKSMYSLLKNLDVHGCTDCLGISCSKEPFFLVVGGRDE
jgi:hypothetical protein